MNNNNLDRTKIEQELTNQFMFVYSKKYFQLAQRYKGLPILEQERQQAGRTAFYSTLKAGSISIATLLFLRTTRKIMLTSRMSTTAASTISQQQNQNHVFNSPFMKPPPLEPLAEQLQPFHKDPMLRNMLSITEFCASVLVFIKFMNDEASTVILELAQIPLKEGRSIMSEVICPDMITLYKQHMQMGQLGQRPIIETDKGNGNGNENENGNGNGNEYRFENEGNFIKDDEQQLQKLQQTQKECLTNPQSKTLSAVVLLCTNCQRRKSYERHLRSMELVAVPVVEEDRMIDEDDGVRSSSSSSSSVNENNTNNEEIPFPIPPPGVPIDFPIDENENYNDDYNKDENKQHEMQSSG